MTPRNNPFVTEVITSSGEVAYDIGGMGQFEMTTPSGATVTLTPQEEMRIAKAALEQRMIMKINASEERKEAAIKAGIGAIGSAVGLALAGIVVSMVVGRGR